MRRVRGARARLDRGVPARHRTPATPAGLAAVLVVVALLTLLTPGAGADGITDKRAEAARIAAKLTELDHKMMSLATQYDVAEAKLGETQAGIEDANRRVDETSRILDEKRREFQRFAVQAYVTGNDSPAFETILTSKGDQAPQKQLYLQTASGNRQELLDDLTATHKKLDAEVAELNEAKGQAEARAHEMKVASDESEGDGLVARK